jgi:hypothetical protein
MSKSDDWQVYLNDPDAFDQDHFAQSLVDPTPEYAIDLNLFFSFVPQKLQIIERINDLKAQTDFNGLYYLPKSSKVYSEDEATRVLQIIVKNLSDHSRLKGELDDAKLLAKAKLSITNDIDEFHMANIDTSRDRTYAFDTLSDAFRGHAHRQSRVYSAVFEAVLNMTSYPMVRNYLINPAVDYPFDFKPFYDLFIGGAAFTDFSDEIVLYVPKD